MRKGKNDITENNYIAQDKNGTLISLLEEGKYENAIKISNNCYILGSKDSNEQILQDNSNPFQKTTSPTPQVSFENLPNNNEKFIGTVLFNCNKTKFLVYSNGKKLLQIFDYKSPSETKLIFKEEDTKIKNFNVKWSPYSPDVFAYLKNSQVENNSPVKINSEISIHKLVKSNSNENNSMCSCEKYSITEEGDFVFKAFTWGESSNIWLKYSIAYSKDNSSSIFLMRPATPSEYAIPFSDYVKMTSTLDSKLYSRFLRFITLKGASRILKHTENLESTEIPIEDFKGKICALHWVNSYLNSYLIIIDEQSVIYILSIIEVDNFIRDFSNSESLSFLSSKNVKFNSCSVLKRIDILANKGINSFNFSISNGIFFTTSNKVFRLFLKRRIISNESANDINNNNFNKNQESFSDEDSIFDIVSLDDKDTSGELIELADFDNIQGVCGENLLLKDGKLITIGKFPDSVKKINLEKLKDEDISEYAKLFDSQNLKQRFDFEKMETRRLRLMQEMVENETEAYADKEIEVQQINSELDKAADRAEQLERRMQNVLEKLQKKIQET